MGFWSYLFLVLIFGCALCPFLGREFLIVCARLKTSTPIDWMEIDPDNDMPNNPIYQMANYLARIVVVKRTEDCPKCNTLRILACEIGRNIQDDNKYIYLDKFFTKNTRRANNDELFDSHSEDILDKCYHYVTNINYAKWIM